MTTLAAVYSAIVLCILIGASRWTSARPFVVRHIRLITLGAAGGFFAALFVLAMTQYRLWGMIEPQKFLLPPYSGIGYFLGYAGWKFFAPYALSGAIAILFFYLARAYNRRHGGQFFYEEEYDMIASALFFTGTPGWVFYLLLVALAAFLITAFRRVVLCNNEKFSLLPLWWPLALFVILIDVWVRALPGFALLHF